MDSPRSWGLFLQATLSLAILLGWFTWPQPEQTWQPQAFVPKGNGAVIGCRLMWPSAFP